MMNRRRRLPFSGKLFLTVTALFLAFVFCFAGFQFHRERVYKASLLNERLQACNRAVSDNLSSGGNIAALQEYLDAHPVDRLRLTVIDRSGTVCFDNRADPAGMQNHLQRKEVAEALSSESCSGYDIMRASSTLDGERWFYSATYFPESGLVIRSALPYTVSLARMLSTDRTYLWLAALLSAMLLFVFYRFTRRLGKNIRQLRAFAEHPGAAAESDPVFPNDELGEVSREIVDLYGKLRESEDDKTRLKRQLTENVAHELKTPVSSIQGYLETLVNEPDMDPGTRDRFLARSYAQSQRLASLLEDISVLNKLDDAPQTYEAADVSIAGLLQSIQSDTAQQLAAKNIIFRALVAPDVVVHGNRSLLYSIFRNLTDNAIAYAGEGVTITVQLVGETPEAYSFTFADNGAGVPAEHLTRLFERFYRVDKGRSRKLGGTGLGLAIVKNAVLLHHGKITVGLAQTGGLEFNFTIGKVL